MKRDRPTGMLQRNVSDTTKVQHPLAPLGPMLEVQDRQTDESGETTPQKTPDQNDTPRHCVSRSCTAFSRRGRPPKALASNKDIASIPNGGWYAWLQVLGSFLICFNTW